MTTPAIGAAGMTPVLVASVTIPSRITTSVQSLESLQAAQFLPAIPPPQRAIIVDGNVTTVPDYPGFAVIPPKRPGSSRSMDAIRSAAKNTAAAYGLNETLSADRASIEQYTVQQQLARQQATIVVTQVIVPD